MKKTVSWLTFCFLVLALSFVPNAGAETLIIFKDVPEMTGRQAYTVPSGKKLYLLSIIIGNPNGTPVDSGAEVKYLIPGSTLKNLLVVGIPADSFFGHNFTNLIFDQGSRLDVWNGHGTGSVKFTLTGNLVNR